MNITNLTTNELTNLIADNNLTDDILAAMRADNRKSVQRLVKKHENEQTEKLRLNNLYKYEQQFTQQGKELIAGVDEAGRGPLAGPVVAAAVILPLNCYIPKLNDSKKLSAATREKIYKLILDNALAVERSIIDEKTIDRINIYQAAMNAMYNSIYALKPAPDQVLIDATPLNSLDIPHLSIIKGDAKSASIAAASIIAKVERDRLMDDYDKKYPEYGFAHHKGYGTKEHIEALNKYGPCPIHRQSFEPIKSMI
ncbi:ribonuclease HII [Pectinatus brassicae]|uniref:Ribonuclease HII n=1 Tax=Pectinatus brassicae TaxID=862415 RepID=A0A840UL77_9FIRM|nr:ribonuclease HII [Pectinatus brassicae]MBB5336497.1 ribonuclease HII [Pectinatus brassicae]